jgi:hypothetical protein
LPRVRIRGSAADARSRRSPSARRLRARPSRATTLVAQRARACRRPRPSRRRPAWARPKQRRKPLEFWKQWRHLTAAALTIGRWASVLQVGTVTPA